VEHTQHPKTGHVFDFNMILNEKRKTRNVIVIQNDVAATLGARFHGISYGLLAIRSG